MNGEVLQRVDEYWAMGMSIGNVIKWVRWHHNVELSFEAVRRRFTWLSENAI